MVRPLGHDEGWKLAQDVGLKTYAGDQPAFSRYLLAVARACVASIVSIVDADGDSVTAGGGQSPSTPELKDGLLVADMLEGFYAAAYNEAVALRDQRDGELKNSEPAPEQ